MDAQSQNAGKKDAVILYAIITGINELSENADAGHVTNLLNKILELVDAVVSLYEGSVEKFSGEEITATFGIPDYTENTPINAVNAALELQSKIVEFNDQKDSHNPLNIKIGIRTGPVLFGKIGNTNNHRNTIMGETITVASRICDLAEDGQILTGNEIYLCSKEKFDFQTLEPVPIKGRKKPLPVYEVK